MEATKSWNKPKNTEHAADQQTDCAHDAVMACVLRFRDARQERQQGGGGGGGGGRAGGVGGGRGGVSNHAEHHGSDTWNFFQ